MVPPFVHLCLYLWKIFHKFDDYCNLNLIFFLPKYLFKFAFSHDHLIFSSQNLYNDDDVIIKIHFCHMLRDQIYWHYDVYCFVGMVTNAFQPFYFIYFDTFTPSRLISIQFYCSNCSQCGSYFFSRTPELNQFLRLHGGLE